MADFEEKVSVQETLPIEGAASFFGFGYSFHIEKIHDPSESRQLGGGSSCVLH